MPIKTDQEALQFVREEVRHEHSLMGQRVAGYVTSQSFLMIAFSMASDKTIFGEYNWFAFLLLPIIGIISSALIIPSVSSASRTIDLWHEREEHIFNQDESAGIKDTFYIERPRSIHKRSMWFAIGLPWVFLAGWIVVIIAMHVLKIIE